MRTFPLVVLLVLVTSPVRSQDFGDAPVGNVIDNVEAYPGVVGRFPSYLLHRNTVISPQHARGTRTTGLTTFYLGTVPPTPKGDTLQDPGQADNDAEVAVLLPGTGPAPLASVIVPVTTDVGHVQDDPVYLNVWIDQNRDGQWKDGFDVATPLAAWYLEWVAQDLPLTLRPDETTEIILSNVRFADPTEDAWIRLLVTDTPVGTQLRPTPQNGAFWDATMPDGFSTNGEVEDHLLEFDVNVIDDSGGGAQLAKPYCTLTLDGVFSNPSPPPVSGPALVLRIPFQPDSVEWGPEFSKIDHQNGCDLEDAVVGVYGYKRLGGGDGEPVLSPLPQPPSPLDSVSMIAPVSCSNPPFTTGDLYLPSMADFDACPDCTLRDQGRALPSDMETAAGSGGYFWDSYYPVPPAKSPRHYRGYVRTQTCGSVTQGITMVRLSESPQNHVLLAEFAGRELPVDFVAENPDVPAVPWPWLALGFLVVLAVAGAAYRRRRVSDGARGS